MNEEKIIEDVISKKLIVIQSKLKAKKSHFNKFGNYNYRTCEDILEAVKPLLKEQDLLLTLTDDLIFLGERYYIKATATIMTNSEKICVSGFAREDKERKKFDSSQLTGSASSYARKYALNGLFLIDDTKDSDTTNNKGKTNKENNLEDVNKAFREEYEENKRISKFNKIKEQLEACKNLEELQERFTGRHFQSNLSDLDDERKKLIENTKDLMKQQLTKEKK